MPSWNIHVAHVERLLREEGARALGVRDANAFLVGNLVPDVYVGYMVPHTTRVIDYNTTHMAAPCHIPLPDTDEFWDRYVASRADVSDVVLGAWAHLVCDHVYNSHTRAFLAAHGLEPGERMRIAKQADFALFGRTLDISLKPHVDEALIRACGAFPQYAIAEADVRAAVTVACEVVDENRSCHVGGEPSYELLTPEFFSAAREEANRAIVSGLTRRAAGA